MAKTVYSSASEVAHLWANKAQDHARNSGSFSFDGEYVYSYNTKIGKYSHNTNFVLLNKYRYSNTSCKHQAEVASAVRYSKTIEIDCYHDSYDNPFKVGNVLRAFSNSYERIAGKLAKATKPQKYIDELCTLIHNIAVYNDYLKACQEWQLTGNDESADEREFAELNALYTEIKTIIDSPDAKKGMQEYIAGKEAREQARLETLKVEFLKSVRKWKKHKDDTIKHKNEFSNWETDFVRLSSDGLFFETHRGAKIKKSEGLALFRILTGFLKEKTQATLPMSVGSYTLEYIKPNGDCKIGCHKFTYKEFEAVYKGLKNKQENETLKIN